MQKNTIRRCFTVVLSFIAGTAPEDYGNINWWLCAAGHYWLLSVFCTSYCSECFKAPTFVLVWAVWASQSVNINLPFFFFCSHLIFSSSFQHWASLVLCMYDHFDYSRLYPNPIQSFKRKGKKKNTHAKAAINQRGSKETSDKDAMIVFLWSQNSSPFFNDSDIAKQDSKNLQLYHRYLLTLF